MKAILELLEMPDKCIDCKLCINERNNIYWCAFTKTTCNVPYANKNNDCPLKKQ